MRALGMNKWVDDWTTGEMCVNTCAEAGHQPEDGGSTANELIPDLYDRMLRRPWHIQRVAPGSGSKP
jgi:hypothetical protein